MKKKLTFIDLFAGCGGLSEGFIQAGFEPLVHIEMDKSACYSLKTRMAYHWLKKNNKSNIYTDYLNKAISREDLYANVPSYIIESVINEEISENSIKVIFKTIDKQLDAPIDLIVGGPPCQAYSLIGRAAKIDKMVGDKRNYLFKFYVKFLERYLPKIFVFENVTGLLSAKDENGVRYFDMMLKDFNDVGYEVKYDTIIADKYGVPQNRKRVIIVGTRKDIPKITLKLEEKTLKTSISKILSDLPKLEAGDKSYETIKPQKGCKYLYDINVKDNTPITLHCARPHNKQDLEIYRIAVEKWENSKSRLNYNDLPSNLKTHKNTSAFTDRFKVVAGDLMSSHTIVAHISKDGHYYIHPDIKQNRSITPREAARLQTFPDNYYFESATGKNCLSAAFRQIGNAVPVYLAKQIAENILEGIKNVK